MKMKSKKALLLGEYTVTIVIAVLCLFLLVYVLFTYFSNSQEERDLRMARAILDELVGKMEEAKTNSPQSLVLLNPEEWIIMSFVDEKYKPGSCDGNCTCVCERASAVVPGIFVSLAQLKEQIEKCNNLGVCRNINENVGDFSVSIPNDVEIDFKDDKYIIKKIS